MKRARVASVVVAAIVAAAATAAAPSHAAFPGTNGLIAFVRGSDAAPGIYVVHPDGSGLHRIAVTTANVFRVSWSPDGKRLAFYWFGHGIYVVAADGSGLVNVAAPEPNHGAIPEDVTWTPGGRLAYLLWAEFVDGWRNTCLVTAAPDGSDVRRVKCLPWPQFREYATPSPDGRRIAWRRDRGPDAQGTYVADQLVVTGPDGSGESVVTSTSAGSFDWSPDGSRIVFAETADPNGGGISIVGADGSGEHRLVADGWAPSWSPDGKRLVFSTDGGLRLIGLNGGPVTTLTNDGEDSDASWQPTTAATAPVGTATAPKPAAKPAPKAKPKSKPKKKKP